METMNEIKTRRPRRSKADIEAAILKAAIAQIKKKGFSMALVTDIVKRAKIEPIVFYNRYKNLDEFYDTFVKRYDYWISDLVRGINGTLMTEDGYKTALEGLFRELLTDSIMAELIRWEIAEGTPTTERTARLREIDASGIVTKYERLFEDCEIDAVALSALVIAGIYFIVLHKDRSTFAGIDINTPEGEQRISDALHKFANMLFREKEMQDKRNKLAECLRQEGLSDEAVTRCLEKIS